MSGTMHASPEDLSTIFQDLNGEMNDPINHENRDHEQTLHNDSQALTRIQPQANQQKPTSALACHLEEKTLAIFLKELETLSAIDKRDQELELKKLEMQYLEKLLEQKKRRACSNNES